MLSLKNIKEDSSASPMVILCPPVIGFNCASFSSSPYNELVGCVNRCLAVDQSHDKKLMAKLTRWVKEGASGMLEPLLAASQPVSMEWNKYISTLEPASKKFKNLRGLEAFKRRGIWYQDKWHKVFIKRELLPCDDPIDGVYPLHFKDPRIIYGNGASGVMDALLGPYFKGYSKHLANVWNYESQFYYFSGSNPEEFEVFITDPRFSFYIEIDFKRWDSRYSEPLIQIEIWVYRNSSDDFWTIEKYVLLQLITWGVTSTLIKFKRRGGRCSGDQNTSPGNTIGNVVVVSFALIESGLRPHDFRMVALGDDNLIQCSKLPHLSTFKSILERLGLAPTVKFTRDIFAVEFCSKRLLPVKDSDGNRRIILTPKLHRVIAKLNKSVSPLVFPIHAIKLLYGKCECLSYECAHLPVFRKLLRLRQEYAIKLLEELGHEEDETFKQEALKLYLKERKFIYYSHNHKYLATEETKAVLNQLYGISCDYLEHVIEMSAPSDTISFGSWCYSDAEEASASFNATTF